MHQRRLSASKEIKVGKSDGGHEFLACFGRGVGVKGEGRGLVAGTDPPTTGASPDDHVLAFAHRCKEFLLLDATTSIEASRRTIATERRRR